MKLLKYSIDAPAPLRSSDIDKASMINGPHYKLFENDVKINRLATDLFKDVSTVFNGKHRTLEDTSISPNISTLYVASTINLMTFNSNIELELTLKHRDHDSFIKRAYFIDYLNTDDDDKLTVGETTYDFGFIIPEYDIIIVYDPKGHALIMYYRENTEGYYPHNFTISE